MATSALRLTYKRADVFRSFLKAGIQRNLSSSPIRPSPENPVVAVVLSGSGVFDGSEIHEASACLVHLTRGGAKPLLFAPDLKQMHVINHAKGLPAENETRNVLAESARIARGKIESLSLLSVDSVDALVFPGGFGVAKNLSNFATEGVNCQVIAEVEKVIKESHAKGKPMAFCCIAPVLAARVLKKCEITLGLPDTGSGEWPHCGAIEAVKSWGVTHDVHGVCVDQRQKIVTTPAFMFDTQQFHVVYDGIGNMIRELLKLV